MTALHLAAANGHAGVVRLLLELGAHPETENAGGFRPAQLTNREDIKDMLREAATLGRKYPRKNMW